MKHGHKIQKHKRAAMAIRALSIFEDAESRQSALARIEDEFGVSTPTARNLVSFGQWLRSTKAVEEITPPALLGKTNAVLQI